MSQKDAHDAICEDSAGTLIPDQEEAVLSLEEARGVLGVSKATVYRWLDEGRIKGMKLGRQWRFYERDVRAVLKDGGETSDVLQSLGRLVAVARGGCDRAEIEAFEDMLDGRSARTPRDMAEALVRLLLVAAIHRGASDVLIQPAQRRIRVRLKCGSVWRMALDEEASLGAFAAVVGWVKGEMGMKEDEHRVNQDGRTHWAVLGKDVEIRASTYPGVFGESVCMRILDTEVLLPKLDKIGLRYGDVAKVQGILANAEGLVLAVGPSGSGKTTLLYSMLLEVDAAERHVMTIEDPVEMTLSGLNQAAVDEGAGYTFGKAVVGMLRHAVDVLMVGEIRDPETAGVLCKASMTGLLCLSTLHVGGTAKAVTRMRDMGVPDFLIADALRAIIAPRVVSMLCPVCRKEHRPHQAVFERLGMRETGGYYTAKGCDHCHGTGFAGKRCVFEVMMLDEEIRSRIRAGADEGDIEQTAKRGEMHLLADECIRAAREGVTSLEEVARVLK